jgi:hypothetical protein
MVRVLHIARDEHSFPAGVLYQFFSLLGVIVLAEIGDQYVGTPMSASPLLTINAAADQLQRDRRTIAAHLRDIPPDDKDAQGRSRWRLSTIVRALNNERPQQGNSAAADAIEAAHEAVAAGLEKMWAAADASGPEAARRVVHDGIGRLVGALDRALERGLVGLKPHEQYLLGLARDKAVTAAIGEILGACQWEVRS